MHSRRAVLIIVLVLIVILSASAVAWAKNSAKVSTPTKLLISAAASLQDSLLAIQPKFEKMNPHIKLSFNFGASGALQKQIEQGAPVDIFLSAGTKQMKALVEGGLVNSASQAAIAANDLVMIMPIDSKIKLAKDTNKELIKPAFKVVAIGIPETVPVGMYAMQTLEYLEIYAALKPKLVQAKDVRQVLTYVETGNADAGFVYRTDAMTSKKVKIMLTVASRAHDAIIYPGGIVKETKHLPEATSFYKYLQGEEAAAVFVQFGFKLPVK